jgi:hypothetical protein
MNRTTNHALALALTESLRRHAPLDPASRAPALAALTRGEADAARGALALLAGDAHPDSVAACIATAQSYDVDRDVRALALAVLAGYATSPAQQALLDIVEHDVDPDLRAAAFDALTASDAHAAAAAAELLLSLEPEAALRTRAARYLAELADAHCPPALRALPAWDSARLTQRYQAATGTFVLDGDARIDAEEAALQQRATRRLRQAIDAWIDVQQELLAEATLGEPGEFTHGELLVPSGFATGVPHGVARIAVRVDDPLRIESGAIRGKVTLLRPKNKPLRGRRFDRFAGGLVWLRLRDAQQPMAFASARIERDENELVARFAYRLPKALASTADVDVDLHHTVIHVQHPAYGILPDKRQATPPAPPAP